MSSPQKSLTSGAGSDPADVPLSKWTHVSIAGATRVSSVCAGGSNDQRRSRTAPSVSRSAHVSVALRIPIMPTSIGCHLLPIDAVVVAATHA